MKYLILCDLDSTLLINHSSISQTTINYINKIVKDGNIFVLATGRPIQATLEFYSMLDITCPISCDNGATIYFPDRILDKENYNLSYFKKNIKMVSFPIKNGVVLDILNKLDSTITCLYGLTDNYIISQNLSKVPEWMIHKDDALELVDGKMVNYLKEDVNILSIFTKDYNLAKEVLDSNPFIKYDYWGESEIGHAFEVQSINASKGASLTYLKDLYQIEDNNTIAFGDSLNDISMLTVAAMGVGMVNAKDEVKAKVKYLTTYDSQNDGVYHYLKDIIKGE